jgi:hypothetical protein
MAGLTRNRMTTSYQAIPEPDSETAQEAATVYQQRYGELETPATHYVMSDAPLKSVDVVPSVATTESNASVVKRALRTVGLHFLGGVQHREAQAPQIPDNVDSSKFNQILIGPHLSAQFNDKWYIAYPAASVMNGGLHNLALSERVSQLVTRASGGPGPATMMPAPKFTRVQNVPRYSTMPQQYPTSSAKG